jgi:hypothetical protein
VVRVKTAEQVWSDLGPQFPHMGRGGIRIKRRSVDQFEGPGSNDQGNVLTSPGGPTRNDTVEADMRERAPNIGVDLGYDHVSSLWSRAPESVESGTIKTVLAAHSSLSEMASSGLTMDATYLGHIMAPWQRKLTTSPSPTVKECSWLE